MTCLFSTHVELNMHYNKLKSLGHLISVNSNLDKHLVNKIDILSISCFIYSLNFICSKFDNLFVHFQAML